MSDDTFVTNTDLLIGLRDAENAAVWESFDQRYRSILIAFARKLGLNHSAAEDAAQETLLQFVKAYRSGSYTRDKGRLRSWLFGIASNVIRSQQRRGGRERVVQGAEDATGFVAGIPDEHTWSAVWEDEWRQAVLNACLQRIRADVAPQTFQAFELYVLKGRPAEEVAEQLGVSRDSVFQSKRRLLERMKELMRAYSDEW